MCSDIVFNSLIDFDAKPRCFDFTNTKSEKLLLFDFSVLQSRKSGLVQLKNPIPADYLHPKYNWIRNKEPDDHADIITQYIFQDLKDNNSTVLFLSIYDKKIFDSVKKSFGPRAILLNPLEDLGISKQVPGQALIQEKINTDIAKQLSEKYGKFDLIITCRLLEHAGNISIFINGLNQLLKPGGKIIVEVPDSTKSLLQGDIAMLWEEHIYYFTPESLRIEFELHGYSLEKYISYYYPQENALVGIFTQNNKIDKSTISLPFGEYAIADIFLKKINYLKSEMKNELIKLKNKFGKIAIFGAGHRTIMFLNLLNLSDEISFAIDDDENKQNYSLPGSNLRIKNSNTIKENKIGVCLLSVNLAIEEKIKSIVNAKSGRGIQFYSISPDSKYSLPIFSTL